MKKKHKIIDKKTLYSGFFKIHQFTFKHKMHNGSWSKKLVRELFSGSNVVSILPYDPKAKKIILIDQFRNGLIEKNCSPFLKEIPAGFIDSKESPKEAAIRECKEETGCKVNKIKKIYSYYPSPGSSQSYWHFFFAEVKSFEGERILGEKDEGEDILVRSYSTDEVKTLLNDRKISNLATIIALQWFYLNYKII